MSDDGELRAFAEDQRRRNLRPSTIKTRDRVIRAFSQAHDWRTATGEDVAVWLDSRHLKARSRYTYMGNLSAFYEFVTRSGVRQDNPVSLLRRPKLPRLLPRPADTESLTTAIAQADPVMKAWLLLAAYAGLRCIEIANLRAEDVHFTDDPPTITVSDGKGGNQRTVPAHPAILAALRPVLADRHRGPAFLGPHGNPWRPATISVYVSRYMTSLGFGISAHQLRHWFGTEMYRSTLDLRLTQELMGHVSPTSTAIYTQVVAGKGAKAVLGLPSLS